MIGFHFGISRVVNRITSLVEPHGGRGRKHIGPAREIFLEDVVLGGAVELIARDPLLVGERDIEREQPGCGRIDGHRGIHVAERDAVEQRAHDRRGGRPAPRPCRPRPRRADDRCRSRSASADRRRRKVRSGPWPGSCDRAHSMRSRSNARHRCGKSTVCRCCSWLSRAAPAIKAPPMLQCNVKYLNRPLCGDQTGRA